MVLCHAPVSFNNVKMELVMPAGRFLLLIHYQPCVDLLFRVSAKMADVAEHGRTKKKPTVPHHATLPALDFATYHAPCLIGITLMTSSWQEVRCFDLSRYSETSRRSAVEAPGVGVDGAARPGVVGAPGARLPSVAKPEWLSPITTLRYIRRNRHSAMCHWDRLKKSTYVKVLALSLRSCGSSTYDPFN